MIFFCKNFLRSTKITITISQAESDKVEIRVSDDGGGIDLSKVKETAVKRGLISKQDANKLSEQESLKLIFQSDVSTSAIITELSGRGLGLERVREHGLLLRALEGVARLRGRRDREQLRGLGEVDAPRRQGNS